ncbi:MAG: hypothetical protein IIA61_11560 [Candidatus Marinimicrobia bacterium]|nr:hypothetical protein [Candidatus Neomarinimicrobiota bacterium]
MIIGVATALFLLLILYFIRKTSEDQNLDLDYAIYTSPKETSVTTQLDVKVPADIIWQTLIKLSNYHLWFPWVHKIQVTNNRSRYVHRHSLDHYTMEVGSWFKIRPFILFPMTRCRFISIEPSKKLTLEMRFFPFNREIVTFTLTPYTNCVEIRYTSINNHLLGFITATMFSWRGKEVLQNLEVRLPEVSLKPTAGEELVSEEAQFVMDDDFINALVAKALSDGKDVLNNITDKLTRAKAKSAFVKAKRARITPKTTPEAVITVEKYLSGEAPPKATISVPQAVAEVSEEILINQYVVKALDGDDEILGTIEDRVFRAKAKSAYFKAKRSGVQPEIPAETPPLGELPTPLSQEQPQKGKEGQVVVTSPPNRREIDVEALIKQALADGNMDAINSIEDKTTRAMAKSTYIKAKRSQGK